MKKLSLLAFALVFATAAVALSVNFNPQTGQGFVGKGEVQSALGWNNKALQAGHGALQFQAESIVEVERTWTCTYTGGFASAHFYRETTANVTGLVSHTARDRNQITGFILDGYDGYPAVTILNVESGYESDRFGSGPYDGAAGTCPAGATASADTGPVFVDAETTIFVRDGGDWIAL